MPNRLLPRHVAFVKWATAHIGEKEHPPGSNTGPFVLECQHASWLRGTYFPWCVCFWLRGCAVVGIKLPYLGAGAYSTLAWYQRHLPGWVKPLKDARPGSAVIFNIGSGHLGTLEKPYDGGRVVYTIDGNWHDSVVRVAHPASLVRGCVDPPEAGTAAPAKPPLFEVASSSSGHLKVLFVGGKSQTAQRLAGLFNRTGGLTVRRRKRSP